MRGDRRQLAVFSWSPVHPWDCGYTGCLGISRTRECVQRSPLHSTSGKPGGVGVCIFRISPCPGIICRVWVDEGSYSAVSSCVGDLESGKHKSNWGWCIWNNSYLNCGNEIKGLKSWIFFQASLRNCINCVHNCEDHLSLDKSNCNLGLLRKRNVGSFYWRVSL